MVFLIGIEEKRSLLKLTFVYLVYSYFFRSYFFLIFIVYLVFKAFRVYPVVILPCVFIGIAFYVAIPVEILYDIALLRDKGNTWRLSNIPEAANTIFLNPFPEPNHVEFLLNNINSFLYLNLPMIYDFSLKNAAISALASGYVFVIFYAITNKVSNSANDYGVLIAAHMIVLNLFEGDLGSYIRHLCICGPFVALAIFHIGKYGRISMSYPR